MELDCNPGPLAPDDMAFMTSHPEKAPVPSLRVKLGQGEDTTMMTRPGLSPPLRALRARWPRPLRGLR